MIEVYVKDIQNALKNHSYFSALSLALTLPDICGMAEFPNKRVGERYIAFYDKFIKNSETSAKAPYLSGEIVYNLRNTYMHQGSPNIDPSKVKEEVNQVDKFILFVSNEKKYEIAISVTVENVAFRAIGIDIAYLCEILCKGSLLYYKINKSKFEFEFDILSQGDFLANDTNQNKDLIGDVITTKLSAAGVDVKFTENLTQRFMQDIKGAMPSKDEQQLRTFFGQNFKEKKFKDKKEEIIAAVLESKTKTQLNGKLTRLFKGEDVKIIFKRLRPQIKNLPGR